jgi:hypothetical protein
MMWSPVVHFYFAPPLFPPNQISQVYKYNNKNKESKGKI